ncbi:hypothetical protein CU097_008568 [Rhizopus azygosporus]|uniref:NAD-dependent 5,10-methylenetetrahydrafolate dehydrogenase n=2 Tax=Rhizopus TaxID=4842 RepID=A0A367J8Z7_RHIAZ|nr:NAD(P)-binding protein [Rhizopus microsporus]RCH86386.1 hypothetical protein CU097_008568 [Rhizopus azygosporus]CEI99617.1 hypothetical protein RMCBS344292_13701 [Rhizopus microsporus]
MSTCKTILASEIARPFRQYLKQRIENYKSKPTLVGLLANQDPASKKYAEWTARTCQETGVQFKLMQVDKHDLEHEIVKANLSKDVHGVMIYYPVFGYPVDASIRNKVSYFKDVEGLSQRAIQNIYENKRHYDKNIVPCTPLAIIKTLEHIGEFKSHLEFGQRLKDKTVTIMNRSDVVGKPLATLLAYEGAVVYSVDANDVQLFTPTGMKGTPFRQEQIIPQSDIVITGVPFRHYRVPTALLKPGVIAINFSEYANFESNVTSKASYFVPAVGKVTVTMLKRNLLRLYDYQQGKQYQQEQQQKEMINR